MVEIPAKHFTLLLPMILCKQVLSRLEDGRNTGIAFYSAFAHVYLVNRWWVGWRMVEIPA
jgi:hypothetical protein